TDRHGNVISDLSRGDIKVLDDGQPPPALAYFLRHDDLPLRIGVLVDVSDSVGPQFSFEKKSAALFLSQVLRPATDTAAIMGFSEHLKVTQGLTSEQVALENGIATLKAGGATALWDAVRGA